ncbi:U-box-domain-containing protein [Cryphonectria parasitica EP155]|uniref:U-box-domain-containing protein n=1 Tax=Cryphonectria parasitica (strain ATCC 38755 / EP155) TaxID=660469 RepID=A0A9P5CR80_CRYP1|nr:U-box-domain-containing protein [Cryphonectria parasitica EP155]KAF3767252.1 U-box-domain-containing protein [Cryphonectria parasitica EP155]
MAVQDAIQFKEQGNKLFLKGQYAGAEGLYSQATFRIVADPKDPKLYTNRAMARCKLRRWEDAIADCQTCLSLTPDNMKAIFYKAEAQLELKDFDNALQSAQHAYELYSHSEDGLKSLGSVTKLVLRCKKERWEDKERRRLRERSELERELVELMENERGTAILLATNDAELRDIQDEWEAKIETLRGTFQLARGEQGKRREVPDWAIDDISFGIMVDPVMTKTGKSYERASLMEHLKRSKTDPITREHLEVSDLRPNLDLRAACAEFLEENGWAVDW